MIKFQVLTADALVSPVEAPDRHAHFRRFELTPEQHLALAERVIAGGARYSASVWDPSAFDWIDPVIDFYKIGSGDLTAWPLLDRHARTRKPLLLSTGLATLDEVVASVARVVAADPFYAARESLAILQCTALYPTPDEQVNLRAIDTLRAAAGRTVGYSHHARDPRVLWIAAACGAEILEFHFTDDRDGRAFRDHQLSLTRREVGELVDVLGVIERVGGDGLKHPTIDERANGHIDSFRRGLYATRPLNAGDPIPADDLVALRPNRGIDVRDLDRVVGQPVASSTPAFGALTVKR